MKKMSLAVTYCVFLFFIVHFCGATRFKTAEDFDKKMLHKSLVVAESCYEGHLLTDELWKKDEHPIKTDDFSARTGGVFGNKDHCQFGLFVAQGNTIFIGFRGTKVKEIQDIVTDTNFVGHNLQNEKLQDGRFSHHVIGGTAKTGVGRCHLGFLKVIRSCTESIRSFVRTYAQEQKIAISDLQVVFTGHSLGGSLSVLGATDLINTLYNRNNANNNVKAITFAAPRVFNIVAANLSDDYHLLWCNHRRFYISNDPIVPHPQYLLVEAHLFVSAIKGFASLFRIPTPPDEKVNTQHTGKGQELCPIPGKGSHRLSTYREILTKKGFI